MSRRQHGMGWGALLAALLGLLALGTGAEAALIWSGTHFVDLDAGGGGAGGAVWTNNGTLADFNEGGDPVLGTFGPNANTGVSFNGSSDYYECGENAPAGLVGSNPTRTIEVWVYNPSFPAEETVVSWGKRGGPAGSNMSFNYGSHDNFGAVGHWSWPDMAWGGVGSNEPAAGEWHHLVYVHDGTHTHVYADGQAMEVEDHNGALNTHGGTPITLAAQRNSGGGVEGGLKGSLAIAQVRVHDGGLSSADIINNYNEGAVAFGRSTLAAPAAQLTPAGATADWQFAFNIQGDLMADGASILDNTPSLRDETGNITFHRVSQSPHYATYTPDGLSAAPLGDGYALHTGQSSVQQGYIWFQNQGVLSTNQSFTVWGRVMRLSDINDPEFLFSRPFNWDVRVDSDDTLAFSIGGINGDTNIPLQFGQWYDVGVVFEGSGAGATADAIRIYVNGQLINTWNGDAIFGTGDWFHIGAGPGGTAELHGLYDRVIFWNQAVSGTVIEHLSTPEPGSVLLLGGGLAALTRRRRKRSTRISSARQSP